MGPRPKRRGPAKTEGQCRNIGEFSDTLLEAQRFRGRLDVSEPIPVPTLGQVTFFYSLTAVLWWQHHGGRLERGDHRLSRLYQAEKEALAKLAG